jgi:membrane fusion protein, multidrug efflux system
MTRRRSDLLILGAALLLTSFVATACSTQAKSAADPAATREPLAISTAAVESRSIDRYLRVTGSLTADAQAEVSAETAGRVIETPVERGTRVSQGALLVRISPSETSAQLQEAEANAAQIEARLGLVQGQTFDRTRVPDVMNAKASLDLAEAEFNRMRSLLDQKVISQSEFDQRRTQLEAAKQSYQSAQNVAEQSYRSLDAARARIALARKAVADTAVRAPLTGLVAERLVSVGDYVTRGTKVATVVRIDPLRVELTVPEQHVSLIKAGQPVRLTVDAYPGEEFAASVRFVSPSLRSDQRALTVEAVASNSDGRLKPGLFATAMIRQAAGVPALLVPSNAIETVAGTSRVYVVKDGRAEARIVTAGDKVGTQVELTSGVSKGDVVVVEPKGRLTDGLPVKVKG